jgi:prepilin-type N-terminal cleavage/methylation domain-containing protein
MKIKSYKTRVVYQHKASEQGFSLLETIIALTTLGICLAYAMPLFLYAKINNSKSQIRTGALIVAQRTFDNIRQKSMTTLPSTNGSLTTATSTTTNPVLLPADITATISPQDALLTYAMGRQYQTRVTYCENNTTANPVCGPSYRQFKVEVFFNDINRTTPVYDLQGTYTDFN